MNGQCHEFFSLRFPVVSDAPEVPLVTCRLSSLAGSFSGHLGMNIKEHSGKRSCKKQINKISFIFFYSCCFQRTTPLHQIGLWTFEPAFSPRFLPTLSPRSIFSTGQRFLPTLSPRSIFSTGQRFLPTLSPRSIFSTGQRFPISNHVTSGSHEPTILF